MYLAVYFTLVSGKTNYERMTGQKGNLSDNKRLSVTIDGSKRTNDITSLQNENITVILYPDLLIGFVSKRSGYEINITV